MTDTPTLTGVDIGEAQRAVGAVLDSLLAETGTSFATWVALNVLATAPSPLGRDELIARMVAGLKIDSASVDAAVTDAESAGLVRSGAGQIAAPTAAGRELHGRISGGIAAVTPQLYGGIPQSDLATAHRVLRTVTDRANAYLAR